MACFNTTYSRIYNSLLLSEEASTGEELGKKAVSALKGRVEKVKGLFNEIPESEKISSLFRTKIPVAGVSWNDIAMIDGWLDWKSMLYTAASVFDPSGVLSWPYLEEALTEYKSDPSTVNAFFLLLALISVIPVGGKPAQLLLTVLKLGIKMKFFPVFFILWMIRKTRSSFTKLGNVDKVIGEAAGKFSHITLKTGENAGDLFKETVKKVLGKDIPESTLVGKNLPKSGAAKVAQKAGSVVKAVAKPVTKVGSAVKKPLQGLVGTSRLGAAVGLPIVAGGQEGEMTEQEKEDFAEFLKNLAKAERIPAYGTSRRPEFGKIGDTRPAKY